jgi:hypothetical protein
MKKTSLFYLRSIIRVSPYPKEQMNLLTHRGRRHHHGNKMDQIHRGNEYLFKSTKKYRKYNKMGMDDGVDAAAGER